MRSFWSDPYLWIHLSGLAALPLFLEGCLTGFAMGDPFLPVWLELLLVVVAGTTPILWMQWQQPFYIFSVVAVSVKPEALTDDQRRLLSSFKLPRNRVLAVLVALALIVALRKVYEIAPIAVLSVADFSTSRWLGLLLASASFFACNLFVQVPVSVASVMLSSESAFAAVLPYPLAQVKQSFTVVGLQLSQILPPVRPTAKPDFAAVGQSTAESAVEPLQKAANANLLTDDLWSEATAPAIAPSNLDAPTEPAVTQESDVPKEPQTFLNASEASSETDLS